MLKTVWVTAYFLGQSANPDNPNDFSDTIVISPEEKEVRPFVKDSGVVDQFVLLITVCYSDGS